MVEEAKLHECVVKDSPQQRGVSCSHSEIVVESSIQFDFDSNRPPRVISLLVVHGSLGQSVLEREGKADLPSVIVTEYSEKLQAI